MSTGKKVFLSILAIMLVIIIGIGGYAAKVYFDVKGTANEIHQPTTRKQSEKREQPVSIDAGEPFSVLLLGLDTGDLGRDEQGRSDTMLVATINPKNNQTTLVSIARDTYTEIVGNGTMDKINHAYAFGGVDMAMDTVENLLDIPLDHYVTINMKGLKELVDAVGGINVENTLEFSQDGTDFPLGTIKLNGEEALSYSRMRYEDPKGDYGRQDRQRKIITAIVKKSLSLSTITGYKSILDTIGSNMKTDLSWEDMVDLQSKYKNAFGNIKQDTLQGQGVMRDGVSYQDIAPEELARVQGILKAQLEK
ncbi:LCP family protein [uncultured Vagococcus sp.]|uniref:LCP family glycopolymer transferase n=1 Tax=uncultured Vagococcus sp. TaxID=189676 RepID=UPI0028D90996|nr:LCP family protein [uncultured Vagococcus sp.]